MFYRHELVPDLAKIKFRYTNLIKSFVHSHFDYSSICCVDILIISGEEKEVKTLLREINSIKGIDIVKFVSSP